MPNPAPFLHIPDVTPTLGMCGVLRPVVRTPADTYFTFQDVAVIKQANDELARGVSFRSLVRSLLATQEGQLSFDFRLDAEPARIITLSRRPHADAPPVRQTPATSTTLRRSELAEEYFRAASSLDDGDESTTAEAAATYRKALELDPYLVAALLNLANIHYSRDELMDGAYKDHNEVIDRTIDSHIRRLRRKFAAAGGDPIDTVHGMGYRISSCE